MTCPVSRPAAPGWALHWLADMLFGTVICAGVSALHASFAWFVFGRYVPCLLALGMLIPAVFCRQVSGSFLFLSLAVLFLSPFPCWSFQGASMAPYLNIGQMLYGFACLMLLREVFVMCGVLSRASQDTRLSRCSRYGELLTEHLGMAPFFSFLTALAIIPLSEFNLVLQWQLGLHSFELATLSIAIRVYTVLLLAGTAFAGFLLWHLAAKTSKE